MKTSRMKFPRRVRIHGGECGAVARALHHEAQKDALMSYERSFLCQADLGKAPGSTIERKQMSTKTTLKRIALVAVSALGFGLVSTVAPASATPREATSITVGTVPTCRVGAACNTPITFTLPAATSVTADTFGCRSKSSVSSSSIKLCWITSKRISFSSYFNCGGLIA